MACGEETAPVDLVPDVETWTLLASAIVLAPSQHSGPCLARMRVRDEDTAPITPPDLDPMLARNPQVGLVDLVDAVRRGATGSVRLDRGLGRGLCAEIAAEAAR